MMLVTGFEKVLVRLYCAEYELFWDVNKYQLN